MSIDGRNAAIVASVSRSARIQPMRSPPQNDFDIEPTVSTRSRRVVIDGGHRGGHLFVEPHVGDRLVDDRAGAGLGDDVAPTAFGRRRHGQPGGIVVVGNQIGQARRELMHRGLHRVEFPAVLGHRHRNRARARGGDRRQGAVVGGLLDEHPIARLDVGGQDQADGVQGAGGHHDLVGLGGKTSRAISFGDGLPQGGAPRSSMADAVQVGRRELGRLDERLGHRAAGADSAAAARFTVGMAASSGAAGATGSAVVLRAPRRALR